MDGVVEYLPRFSIKTLEYQKTAGNPVLAIALDVDKAVPIQSYKVYVDDRYIATLNTRSNLTTSHEALLEVPLPSHPKILTVEGINPNGSMRVERPLKIPNAPKRNKDIKGDLYLLSIGINQYPLLERSLQYAAADAQEFHQMIRNNTGTSFNQVHEWLLTDNLGEQPTRHRIMNALKALKKSKPNDTVIVFLAGHGAYQGKDYYFLSRDSEQEDSNSLAAETAVNWQDIQIALGTARGQRILVVDTCHAQRAFNPRLVKDAFDEKIAVFTATDDDYVVVEQPELKHGVLTYSLLQGLRGKADSVRHPNQEITLAELKSYVDEEVPFLSHQRQRPQVFLGKKAEHYVITEVKNNE